MWRRMIHGFTKIKKYQQNQATLWEHGNTGAKVLSMCENAQTKGFGIAFRTPAFIKYLKGWGWEEENEIRRQITSTSVEEIRHFGAAMQSGESVIVVLASLREVEKAAEERPDLIEGTG